MKPGTRVVLVLLLAVAPALRAEGSPDPAEGLHAALLAGDTGAAWRHARALYEAAGVEIPPFVELREQSAFEFLSRYSSVEEAIIQSRLLAPGEGWRYWGNWSEELTGGRWDPKAAFADEAEARLVGNYTLLGILVHELGHAIAEAHGVHPADRSSRELLADEYATRLLADAARVPALSELRARYRRVVAGRLRAAVPDGVRIDLPADGDGAFGMEELRRHCASFDVPAGVSVAGYVSFQLARQAVLLDAADAGTLADFHRAVLARRPPTRWLRPEVVVETVDPAEVPAWARHAGSPASLWSVAEEDVVAAIAAALGGPEFASDPADLWRTTGPDSAVLFASRPGALPEAPSLLVRVRRGAEGAVAAEVLARGRVAFSFGADLVADGGRVAVYGIRTGAGGPTLGWYEPGGEDGGFREGPLSGRKVGGLPPDGELSTWPLTWRRGRVHFAGEGDLVIGGAPLLRVVTGGRLCSLAGGIRGGRDGTDPARVRFSAPEILAVDGETLWIRDVRPDGPVYRRLRF